MPFSTITRLKPTHGAECVSTPNDTISTPVLANSLMFSVLMPPDAFDMDFTPVLRDEYLTDGAITAAIRVYLAVAFQSGEPVPSQLTDQFQVLQ